MARVYTDPFEMADALQAGWAFVGNMQINTSIVRKWKTFGGLRSIKGRTTATIDTGLGPSFTEHGHLHVKCGAYMGETGTLWQLRLLDDANSVACTIEVDNLGAWKVIGPATYSSATTIVLGQWYLVELEVYLHNSLGYYKLWVDDILVVDSGAVDTLVSTTKMSKIQFRGNETPYWDDLAVNNITMRYDTEASGPFSVGETITGGTSTATAIITALQDDGTTGVLTLEGWDGTSFSDGETITGGTSSTTAKVDAPNAAFIDGFEPNSGRCGNGFVIGIPPNANGTTSGLTGSDGNSTDNYLLVDERATTSTPTTYVDATAALQKDTYKGDVSGSLPTAVSSLVVGTATFAQSSLTGIDGLNSVVRISGTDYDGDRVALGAGFALDIHTLPVDPSISSASDQTWLLSTITDAGFEYGTKFVA